MAKKLYTNIDGQNAQKLVNMADGSAAQDYVTKNQMDNALLGLGTPIGVKVRTTGNVTISTALNNGDSIDGVTLATGDLVLVDQQSTAAEDGVYVVGVSPARYSGLPTGEDARGLLVVVEAGTANGGKLFIQTANPAVVGTNGLSFTALTAGVTYTADGNGIELTSTTFGLELDGTSLTKSASGLKWSASNAAGTGLSASGDALNVNTASGITTSGDNIVLDTSTAARWATALGPGSAGATITQAHGFGHKDVLVNVRLESSGEDITAGVNVSVDATNITITFDASQADRSAFRLIWVG